MLAYVFLPVGTDAPIYHRPFGTLGMILLNVLVFVLQNTVDLSWFMLHYDTVNPISWFTVHLMHLDIGHLFGNMLFLGLCGLIVEGKVGWLRFIFLYFAIGVTMAAPVQLATFLLGVQGAALGASAVICGLILVAMLWAPENEVTIAYGGIIWFRPFFGSFQVTILMAGFFLIAMDFITAGFQFFHVSTASMHLAGVAAGAPYAYLFIKYRQVNCEGADMFSVWRGEHGKVVLTIEEERIERERIKELRREAKKELDAGMSKVNFYIDNGHYGMAQKRFAMLRRENHTLKMTESQLLKIIDGSRENAASRIDSIPVIKKYLKHYQSNRIPLTLMLSKIIVVDQKSPRRGLKTLSSLKWNELDPKQKQFLRTLVARAKQMVDQGVIELEDAA